MYQEKGLYMPFAKLMKDAVDVPVICAGRMDNPDTAVTAVAGGVCDIVSLGRPLLADPDYVNKVMCGDTRAIRPCISCHEGCMGRVQTYSALNCAVNPQTCRERTAAFNPVLKRKKVLVAGGGLIGCETALWLSRQGRQVTIVEVLDKLLAENGPLCHANSDMLEALIPYNGIGVKTGTRIEGFEQGRALCRTDDKRFGIRCDSLVLAVGYHPETTLYEQVRFKRPNLWLVGDARRVGNIMYAIWDAFEVANNL